MTAQEILWESAEPWLYCSYEDWLACCKDWTFGTSEHLGKTTGAYMVSPEGEIHITVTVPGRAITRKRLNEIAADYPKLTTKTPKWMDVGVAPRLGFVLTGEDEFWNFYERITPCLQSQS